MLRSTQEITFDTFCIQLSGSCALFRPLLHKSILGKNVLKSALQGYFCNCSHIRSMIDADKKYRKGK